MTGDEAQGTMETRKMRGKVLSIFSFQPSFACKFSYTSGYKAVHKICLCNIELSFNPVVDHQIKYHYTGVLVPKGMSVRTWHTRALGPHPPCTYLTQKNKTCSAEEVLFYS